MSTIDQLIILIDDKGEISHNEIGTYHFDKLNSVVYSALERLVRHGLINKSGKAKEAVYTMSKNGQMMLDLTLNNLENIAKSHKTIKVYLIMFSVPELNKSIREKIRRTYVQSGFTLLRSGVIMGFSRNEEKIIQISRQINAEEYIEYFQIDNPVNQMQKILSHWDLRDLAQQYQQFIKEVKKLLSVKKDLSDEDIKIQAKTLVYNLAQIAQKDPGINENQLPCKIYRSDAVKYYQKIRNLCYI